MDPIPPSPPLCGESVSPSHACRNPLLPLISQAPSLRSLRCRFEVKNSCFEDESFIWLFCPSLQIFICFIQSDLFFGVFTVLYVCIWYGKLFNLYFNIFACYKCMIFTTWFDFSPVVSIRNWVILIGFLLWVFFFLSFSLVWIRILIWYSFGSVSTRTPFGLVMWQSVYSPVGIGVHLGRLKFSGIAYGFPNPPYCHS